MWEQVILTGASALAASALSVPAARSWMLGTVDHDWLADELELDCIDADRQTVRTKNKTLFRVFRLRGTSYDAKIQSQQEQMLKSRSALMHGLGSLGLRIHLFAIKRQQDISFEASWPSPALTEIGDAEKALFQSSYYTEWFVLIASTNTRALIEGSAKVGAMASIYQPQVLTSPVDEADPCPLTGFLNYLISGDFRKDLPTVSDNISGNLPTSDLFIDKKSGLIEARTPTRKIHQIIAVREWSDLISGRLLGDILALKGDVEVSQICDPLDRDEALLLYKRKKSEQSTALIGNPALAAECEAITQLLSEGNTTLFHTQLQIIVRADDETSLNQIVTEVAAILGNARIKYSIETAGAPICWFARLPKMTRRKMPGNSDLLRPLILQEQNIAALWAFHHAPSGMTKSPLGDRPVRNFRTPSGQTYAFQFHVSDKPQSIGNYLLFAPSGGGKSTLMMHLLGGLAKFENVQSYIFDSKEGARYMVEAMGGIYQGYEDLQLNPLDVGEDTPKHRQRIYSVLKAMAADAKPSPDDDETFAHAVELAFQLDVPDRTLNAIYEYAFARRTPLRKSFARWVTDSKGRSGMNAHVFSAPHDSLSNFLKSSHMVGINMNEALDDPIMGPPVVAHISEAISKSAANNSKGFCIFIDEAAKLLQNDGFKSLAQEMYREYRKLNGSVGMAFQDPAALFRSGVAEAFLENTATLIFLPNSLATRESLEPFNLNEEQIGFVLGGEYHTRKSGERQVLIVKRDAATGFDESVILDVDLAPLGDSLRFYRAGVDANKDLANLKQTWGAEWQMHL